MASSLRTMLFRTTIQAMVLVCAVVPSNAQIALEGSVPAGIGAPALVSEYYRIYRIVAPEKRPVKWPLRIIYFTKSHSHGTGFALPEWGGGGAIGDSLIIIPVDFKPLLEQSFPQITVHEIVHSVLSRAYPGLQIPRWFHEGAAMLLSGELSWEENATVSKAIFLGRLMPLASIDSVNSFKRGKADLAYSQSHLAALYLVDQYGMEVLPKILRAGRRSGNLYAGILEATGLNHREFEQAVVSYIASKYRLVFIVTDSYLWWGLIALLFIAGYIATKRRNRKRAAAMEEAERIEMERGKILAMESREVQSNGPTQMPPDAGRGDRPVAPAGEDKWSPSNPPMAKDETS
jgi:hypothetical protein